jgi:hypothetical protein
MVLKMAVTMVVMKAMKMVVRLVGLVETMVVMKAIKMVVRLVAEKAC